MVKNSRRRYDPKPIKGQFAVSWPIKLANKLNRPICYKN